MVNNGVGRGAGRRSSGLGFARSRRSRPAFAAQTGGRYEELMAEGMRYGSKDDYRREAKSHREAIALRGPARARARGVLQPRYSALRLGAPCGGRTAVPRCQGAHAGGFGGLGKGHCMGLRQAAAEGVQRGGQPAVVERRGAQGTRRCRRGFCGWRRTRSMSGGAWEVGPRSAVELKEAATHFDRSAALCDAPAWKVELSRLAGLCSYF
eukprot:scaffold48314_cov51-Phaeocystis_antarctica.AAC.3